MDKHIEECICYVESCCPWMGDCTCQCICDILRTCEQRVLDGALEQGYANGVSHGLIDGYEEGYQEGYAAGLDAAEAAVLAVDPASEEYDDWYPKGERLALAAIRALKEKP